MMRLCVVLLVLASFAYADEVPVGLSFQNTAYGYLENVGIPRAEKIRKAEESQSRIIGGLPAVVGQYPFMAGLLGDIIGMDATSVCGASLVSPSRLVTAAHCWNDGVHQVWRFTVVLASNTLFTGGTRITSSVVAMHPNWSVLLGRNDVAMIYLPNPAPLSTVIAPIALPSALTSETFAGESGIAVGFGITGDNQGISATQSLNHARLNIITNGVCSVAFPFIIQDSHLCTSGLGTSVCSGDSGGPLLIDRDGEQVLVGVASFVSILGCESGLPAVFARVTSFVDFINSHL